MASRALADSPGGGGSRAGWLSPPGESEEVTDANDDEEESSAAFVAPDDDVTDGRMSAAIEKRLDPRGSLTTVLAVVRLGVARPRSESTMRGVEPPGLRSSSSAEPSRMSLARPRVGESPPPAFETICATVLAAVAAFWNVPVVTSEKGKNSTFATHLFLFEALRLSPLCPPILKPDLKE